MSTKIYDAYRFDKMYYMRTEEYKNWKETKIAYIKDNLIDMNQFFKDVVK